MSSESSSLSSLEILQLYSNGGRYLEDSNLYLSEDGKEIFFLGGGSSSLPIATRNATEEDVLESYTLASIYLLCIYPNDLRNYRKSCERANCIPVKTTDKPKILTMLLGEDYYNKIMSQQQQQQQQDSTTISKDKDKQKHAEEGMKIKDQRGKQHEHSSKKHHHREQHSSSKSKEHHHHHKHKASLTNKEISSSSKRSKTSLLSKDQVLENLTLVVDKRSDKKYQTPTEEDTPMKGTSEDPLLSQQLQTPEDANQVSENTSPAVVVSSEEEELQKKLQLRELLSDKSLVVTDDEVLANDLQKTNIITGMEIPVGDSFSILRAPGRDLSRVLEMYTEAMKQQQRQSSRGGVSKSSSPSKADAKDSKSKKNIATGSMKPVIIVPNTMTSPITILNSIEFFSQGKYVSRDTIVKQRTSLSTTEIPKQQPYTFTRKISPKYLTSSGGGITAGTPTGGNPSSSSHNLLEYEIIDNPIKYLKSRQDWDRIVAVVALGASWQFKGWHGKFQIPVELFNKVKGYYFGMQENINVPKEVQGWNIQTILLARDNRSSDGVAHAKFWNTLDEWMAIHKPELLPSSVEA